jgi:copper homeostasis protein
VCSSYILEISVETLEAALAAQRGGAQRIELCSDLEQGGLTPETELMRAARERVNLPLFAMIRPRAGNFVYSDSEFAAMQRDIRMAQRLGMDGVVLGLLQQDSRIDVERSKELVEFAGPLPVTFHRAFDVSASLCESLEEVIRTGAMRLLTSGGAASAPAGIASIAKLIDAAANRIIVIPGAGINASNVVRMAEQTGAREFHSGLGSVVPRANGLANLFEAEVHKLANGIAEFGRSQT